MNAIWGMGYDGITHIGGGRVNPDSESHRVYIALDPEQVKNTGNKNPTSNPDIRYSTQQKENATVADMLKKENEKLKADVERLNELLKLQRTITGGTKFTESSVEAAARVLKKNAGATGNTAELASLLNSFYE